MKKIKPTKKRLEYLIGDEKKAAAEYKRYGFASLSKDEARHKKFLERKLKMEEKSQRKKKSSHKRQKIKPLVMQDKTKKNLRNASKKLKILGGKGKKAMTKKYEPRYKVKEEG